MEKIINALLKSKFPETNIDSLMEVISVTPNSIMATEMLCGLYEKPDLLSEIIDNKNRRLTLVSYDAWRDEVVYKYTEPVSISAYVLDENKHLVTYENINTYKVHYSSENAKTVTAYHLTETREVMHSTDLKGWSTFSTLIC